MKYIIALLAIFSVGVAIYAAPNSTNSAKIVCYFGSWAKYRPGDGKFDVEDIDPMMCTHIIFGFAGLSQDNKIYALDAYNELEENWGKGAYKRFTNLKQKNPSLKALLAIGGWNEGSAKYSKMASTKENRKTFTDSVIPFLKQHGFDGLDLDWEYPTQRGGAPEDRKNFATLCAEMRTEFDKYGYLLTAAVSAGKNTVAEAYDIPSISKSLDFINVMAYDLHGAWESFTGHHAAFDKTDADTGDNQFLNIKYAMEFWQKSGCPASKLIVGMPTYGRGFTLQDPNKNGLYAPANQGIPAGPYTREAGFWGYNEICEELKKGGWTTVRNEKVVGPYSYNGNRWIGYDDEKAIAVKSMWLKANGYGGAMFWSLETDDFHGKCGGEKNILIKTAYRTLVGDIQPEPIPTGNPITPKPTAGPTPTPTSPPSDGKCSTNGQTLGKLCDSKFSICNWNGNSWDTTTYTCNSPLFYDPNIKNCNWGNQIGCE